MKRKNGGNKMEYNNYKNMKHFGLSTSAEVGAEDMV